MENFKIGEIINKNVYSYDDQGNEYIRKVSGKVIQITSNLVVINNGKFNESFKFCEFKPCQNKDDKGIAYEISLESYSDDVVKNCINDLKNKNEGFVFNEKQLDEVLGLLSTGKYSYQKKSGIFYIKN